METMKKIVLICGLAALGNNVLAMDQQVTKDQNLKEYKKIDRTNIEKQDDLDGILESLIKNLNHQCTLQSKLKDGNFKDTSIITYTSYTQGNKKIDVPYPQMVSHFKNQIETCTYNIGLVQEVMREQIIDRVTYIHAPFVLQCIIGFIANVISPNSYKTKIWANAIGFILAKLFHKMHRVQPMKSICDTFIYFDMNRLPIIDPSKVDQSKLKDINYAYDLITRTGPCWPMRYVGGYAIAGLVGAAARFGGEKITPYLVMAAQKLYTASQNK